ncbi:type II toxin-antitoxin system HicB family antitoxin [Candidatus Gracilibacteria bacterium]|nr:type II toxin-antitoxin system HicB family antitoxin [Candidatus Gracilibacteria bacterium]
MDFTVIIQQDKEGWFLGSIPTLHGCRTQAKTLTQLYKRLEEVARLCLESQKQEPEEEVKFIGVQNLKISTNA